ncbi:MAG: altronate dehydratase family protein [Candidatus Ancillula sp.]|jgi:altronate hydrolase|nr:altronate dehydratase family protein [Candidatus Ancillula sp.]
MKVLKIDSQDNVCVCLEDAKLGQTFTVDGAEITLVNDVPAGHKIALEDISKGENVIKYGYPIGHAIENIGKGEWIHTHNVKTNLEGVLEYGYHPEQAAPEQDILYTPSSTTFKGYRRSNGQVGVRNDLYIVPTVGCINQTAELIKQSFLRRNPDALKFFDNVIVIKHPYGCSQLGKDHANTRDFLANTVLHPNAGAVLVVGLGCENNTIEVFRETLEKGARGACGSLFNPENSTQIDHSRIRFLIAQQAEDEVEAGADILAELLDVVRGDTRSDIPISELRVGLKCGGSDGFSGITANPLLGKLSDFLTAAGGTTILTEVPEMFGAETILMNRARNRATFDKVVHLINDFKQYFIDANEVVYENPSPGNKAGGITTLEDKSLGCTQKAGSAKVVDVINYADRVKVPGLNLLQSPGNDLVAASALAVAGCHIVLFTTGRGNPFGTFVPTVKVASNPQLAARKKSWIDFNAGRLLKETFEEVTPDFIDQVLRVASGEKTCSEQNGYSEVAIFKTGITL